MIYNSNVFTEELSDHLLTTANFLRFPDCNRFNAVWLSKTSFSLNYFKVLI